MAVTRRAILAGGVVAGAALTAQPGPMEPAAGLREELECFLGLVAASRIGAGTIRAALAASAAALGAARRRRLEQHAADNGVSPQDFLAYALMDGLPLPRELLTHFLPRGIAFAVSRRTGQSAMVGAAFLPTSAPLLWRQGEGYSGLATGSRPGMHLGVNQGLALATLCGPSAVLAAPGVPAPLAAEFVLQMARSPEAALPVLAELAAPRPGLHIICDMVTGCVHAVPAGDANQAGALATGVDPAPILVGSAVATAGEEHLDLLQRHLRANLGWLTLKKALAILDQALPGAVRVVLDLDRREGRLESSQASQGLAF